MKPIFLSIPLTFALLSPLSATTELVVNGGFEKEMENWGYEQWDNRPLPGLIDHSEKVSGAASFKMGLPGTEGGRWVAQEIKIEEAGKDRILSFALKLNNVPEDAAKVRLAVDGRGFLRYGDMVRTGGTFDWTTYKFPVSAAEIGDSKKVVIFVYHDAIGQGTVYLDDISLTEGTLSANEETPATIAFRYAGPGLSGDTSRPDLSTYPAGQPVELNFSATGLTTKDPVKLQLSIVDEHERPIKSIELPVQPDPSGTWKTTVAAPNDKLGFYRVYAKLSNGATLRPLGSRPAGFLSYIVVPDPAQRKKYTEEKTRFGMQNAISAESYSLIGAHWILDSGLYWKDQEPQHAGQFGPEQIQKYVNSGWPEKSNYPLYTVPSLFFAPEWPLVPGTLAYNTGTLTKEGEKAWADYCRNAGRACALKFPERKSRVYQITWEPIQPWGFKGTNADLIRIYEIAHAALHEGDPGAIVAGPCRGLEGSGDPDVSIKLLQLGLGKHLDGYVMHPYFNESPEKNGMAQIIRKLKEAIRSNSGKDLPLYGTEQGYATDENISKEAEMASVLMRQSLITLGEGFSFNIAFCFYDYRMGGSRTGYGYYYNLVKDVPFGPNKAGPKCVAAAYAAQSMLLEGSDSAGAIEWLGDTVWGYAFERDGGTVLALWNYGDQPRNLSIPTGATEVTTYDWMGNARKVQTPDGQLALNGLTREPVYVTGVSSLMWGAEAGKVIAMRAPKIEAFPGQEIPIEGKVTPVNGLTGGVTLVLEDSAGRKLTQPVSLAGGQPVPFRFNYQIQPARKPGVESLHVRLLDSQQRLITATSFKLETQPPLAVELQSAFTPEGKPALKVVLTEKQGQPASGKLEISLKELIPGVARGDAPMIDLLEDPGKTREIPGAFVSADVQVPPNQARTAILPLPDVGGALQPAKKYEALTTITTEGGVKLSQAKQIHFLGAQHCSHPMQVDGDLSDWDRSSPTSLRGPENVVRSPQYFPQGFAGQLYYAWSKEGLYLAAEVSDDAFCQEQVGAGTWQGDSLQLAFNLRKNGEPRNSEINVALTRNGPEAFRSMSYAFEKLPAGLLSPDQAQVAVRRSSDNKLCYEMFFSWPSLGAENGETFQSGDKIGVAATINEVRNAAQGDPSALGLFGGITPDKDPAKQGELTLQ